MSDKKKENAYKEHSSLDFDIMRAQVFEKMRKEQQAIQNQWKQYCLGGTLVVVVGIFIGFIAFVITWLEE
jgi:hypothetical protein